MEYHHFCFDSILLSTWFILGYATLSCYLVKEVEMFLSHTKLLRLFSHHTASKLNWHHKPLGFHYKYMLFYHLVDHFGYSCSNWLLTLTELSY